MGFKAFAGGGGLVGGGLVVPVLLHYNARTGGALFLVMKNWTSQPPFCIIVQVFQHAGQLGCYLVLLVGVA